MAEQRVLAQVRYTDLFRFARHMAIEEYQRQRRLSYRDRLLTKAKGVNYGRKRAAAQK